MICRYHRGTVSAERLSSSPFHGLDSLEAEMAERDVPAISAAALVDGEIVDATWGVRSPGDREIRPDTLFQAASISKAVTAIGVLRLVDQSVLDLDADISDYLKSWRMPSIGGWEPRLTLRRLLTHSAGLNVHGFPGYRRDVPLPTAPQILDGEAPANTEAVRVFMFPGLVSKYSGGGTTIVQLIMEDVTGAPFAELMRELVLQPAGIGSATFGQPLPDSRHGSEALAHVNGEVVPGGWHVYPEVAPAGLWCTPTDLVRLVAKVVAAVDGTNDAILSQQSAIQLVTPQFPEVDGGTLALGFFLEGPQTHRRFGHTGGNAGFQSVLSAAVDGTRAVAVMGNSSGSSGLFKTVIAAVARNTGWQGFETEADVRPGALAAPRLSFADIPARYQTEDGRVFELVELDHHGLGRTLGLVASGQPPLPLQIASAIYYYSSINMVVRLKVEDGEILGLTLSQLDRDLFARRIEEADPS